MMQSKFLKIIITYLFFITLAHADVKVASDETEKQTILLKNIESLIDNHEFTAALDILDKVDIKNLTSKQVAKYQMLRANLFFKDVDVDSEIETSTETPAVTATNIDVTPNLAHNSSPSSTTSPQPDSYQEFFSADNALNYSSKNPINNQNIWQKLVTQNTHSLDAISNDLQNDSLKPRTKKLLGSNKEFLAGWLELAAITKKTSELSNDDFYQSIFNWQKKFTGHPAASYIKNPHSASFNTVNINKIVILLPSSGSLAKTAEAIKEGIITAHFKNPSFQKPELVFMNASSKPDSIIQEYNAALKLSPDIIIGPLGKESVEILSKQINLNSPAIIALNYTSDNQPTSSNFYQFGLSAEDESEQAATKAWNDGARNALILVDDNPWGTRVSNVYKNTFTQSGGSITKIVKIRSTDNLKRLINTVIATEQSQYRKNALEVVLNQKINFQPRHRKDFDHIFIATSPTIAKQIKPILKFYYADYIPVFATSNIYNYISDASRTINDLEGIQFCDIPWIVNQDNVSFSETISELRKVKTKDFESSIRLYALGMDAYALSNNLNKLNYAPEIGLSSNTGHLYKDSNNKIHRLLSWVTIENGKIKKLDELT